MLLAERLDVPAALLRSGRHRCPCCGDPHGRPVSTDSSSRALEFGLFRGGDFGLGSGLVHPLDADDLTRHLSVLDEPVGAGHHVAQRSTLSKWTALERAEGLKEHCRSLSS
ncbi:hypothetical protein [Streptomyces sp. YS415]|uniref:hypothetical protein n=1 Tax=Streptomyces sp. YS415 TaxID=2944806 RepID=UPI002020209F|nr:hypothetical protein [Streptomyces sp. YS415]MCL7426198.1 hypothetical protein [Streptomyces sp. YS415]